MMDYVRQIIGGQFEASLCMLSDCIEKCPPDRWDGVIGKYPFWQVAYHTLCFVDLYLSPGKEAFQLRPIHPAGWSEFDDEYPSRRFEKIELMEYLVICRAKLGEALAVETFESLQQPTGFSWLNFSRGELHLYNMRHIQHHAGQLSAYLRRTGEEFKEQTALRWMHTGWR